jgi:hypothetical protein
MRGTLEFNLDDQEDEVAYMRCVKAKDMALVLWDTDQYLRDQIKHGQIDESAYKALDTAREVFRTLMSNYNVDLDELLK